MMMLIGPRHASGAHDFGAPLELARSNEGDFSGGWMSDSWTPGPKRLCHRHPTGPHPSGLSWTPAKGDSTKSNFALVLRLGFDRHEAVEPAPCLMLLAEDADRPLQPADGVGVDHRRGVGRLVVGDDGDRSDRLARGVIAHRPADALHQSGIEHSRHAAHHEHLAVAA